VSAIRVVIVDDEPIARRGIRNLLAAHEDVEIVGEARNGREAVGTLESLAPDLVFLDVQMPELDGFAVLRQVDPRRLPDVIFVTAHDTFAVRAFDEHAVDYLVKPVQEQRFRDALARARERLRSREAGRPQRLLISTNGVDLIVDAADIIWIEAVDYYASVHTIGRHHLIRQSLASLEERLDGERFVRVHRSAIVNLAQVREVRDTDVLLRDGTRLPLSRRRREQVASAIRRFAG
jgi:two-component system, LytTR family, response regulator